MSLEVPLIFPELLFLNDYGGDFKRYFEIVYAEFEQDFIRTSVYFYGVRVSTQKHPLVDNVLHRTFYHITHEGEDESNRSPDISRMERIRYPKYIIENCPHSKLLIWENQRGRDTRVLIFNEEESYLVVLTKRPDYYLFWTAYPITKEHQRRKLMTEYKMFKNNQAI